MRPTNTPLPAKEARWSDVILGTRGRIEGFQITPAVRPMLVKIRGLREITDPK